jgi:hypothetical protein
MLISDLLVSRMNSFSRPENLEDAIHRIRTFVPCFPDEDHAKVMFVKLLAALTHQRFQYFGITGTSGEIPNVRWYARVHRTQVDSQETGNESQIQEKIRHLDDIEIAIQNGEITDVEAAVERTRTSHNFQQSGDHIDHWSSSSLLAMTFASILFQRYRDLRKVAPPQLIRFDVGNGLWRCLISRLGSFHLQEDFEELMQLFPEVSNDSSGEVFIRLKNSCFWAVIARAGKHPLAKIAYETAMSLLQDTLDFCPTLQSQHLRLAEVFKVGWRLPSQHASYQIENDRIRRAIETLE